MAISPPPGSPRWPCRTHAVPNLPPRLVAALYLVQRDQITPGAMERLLLDAAGKSEDYSFTNVHLEGLARSHATYLLNGYYGEPISGAVEGEDGKFAVGAIVRLPNGQHAQILRPS